jgi:hypothetical protein
VQHYFLAAPKALLNALAAERMKGTVTGTITANGAPITEELMARIAGKRVVL